MVSYFHCFLKNWKKWCSKGAGCPECHCTTTATTLAQGVLANSVPVERVGSATANITKLFCTQLSLQHSPILHGATGSRGSHWQGITLGAAHRMHLPSHEGASFHGCTIRAGQRADRFEPTTYSHPPHQKCRALKSQC